MKVQISDALKRFSDDVKALNPELFGEQPITSHGQLNQAVADDAKRERRNKFGNIITAIGDEKFDSKSEADRWMVLRAKQEAGEIKGLMRQVKINLMEGFTYKGQKIRGIDYTADFVYTIGSVTYIEDLKSPATARATDFRLRWRLLQNLYKDRDDVICITTGRD